MFEVLAGLDFEYPDGTTPDCYEFTEYRPGDIARREKEYLVANGQWCFYLTSGVVIDGLWPTWQSPYLKKCHMDEDRAFQRHKDRTPELRYGTGNEHANPWEWDYKPYPRHKWFGDPSNE